MIIRKGNALRNGTCGIFMFTEPFSPVPCARPGPQDAQGLGARDEVAARLPIPRRGKGAARDGQPEHARRAVIGDVSSFEFPVFDGSRWPPTAVETGNERSCPRRQSNALDRSAARASGRLTRSLPPGMCGATHRRKGWIGSSRPTTRGGNSKGCTQLYCERLDVTMC